MEAIKDKVDSLINFSGGSYVSLATLTILGLAIAEYLAGAPVSVVGPDGKNIIYMVHHAPEWFVSAVGVYTIILGVFALSKPINAYIAQKGTPPPEPAPTPAERPLEK